MLVNTHYNELYVVIVSAYHFCAKTFFLYKILVLLYVFKEKSVAVCTEQKLKDEENVGSLYFCRSRMRRALFFFWSYGLWQRLLDIPSTHSTCSTICHTSLNGPGGDVLHLSFSGFCACWFHACWTNTQESRCLSFGYVRAKCKSVAFSTWDHFCLV